MIFAWTTTVIMAKRSWRGWGWVVIGGLLGSTVACDIASGVTPDAGSLAQFEHKWPVLTDDRPLWHLLVVDDAPTEAARRLREQLAEDLRGYFNDVDRACCEIRADPALYRPIDWRLIVVGASGTLPPRFQDEEGLHAVGVDATPDLLNAFETAGGQAILATETSEVLPFLGAAELAHYLNLTHGAATPRSSAEAELVSALSEQAWSMAALATTRPDESPEDLDIAEQVSTYSVYLLDRPEDGSCPYDRSEHASLPSFEPLAESWSSSGCYEPTDVFPPPGVADCALACMPRAPSVDDSGKVACRVYGEFLPDVDCENSPGWTFLEQGPPSGWGFMGVPLVNLCELRQAEGDALQACIHDFACEGCEPSFCFRRPFTETDDADPAHQRPTPAKDFRYCERFSSGGPSWERLRIVHGAEGEAGFLRAVCQQR